MENPKKELIKEVVDLFEDYEEAYVPGEWESFSKNQKKRAFVIPLWMKIAAVLLIMIAAVPFFWKSSASEEQIAAVSPVNVLKKKEVPAGNQAVKPESTQPVLSDRQQGVNQNLIPANSKNITDDLALNKPVITGKSTEGNVSVIKKGTVITSDEVKSNSAADHTGFGVNNITDHVNPVIADNAGTVKVVQSEVKEKDKIAANTDPVIANNAGAVKVVQSEIKLKDKPVNTVSADSIRKGKTEKTSTIDFLLAESKHPVEKTKKASAESKWDFGLEVAPVATHSNVSFGGGLTTAYRLSDKISLSSGISLLQLDAGRKDMSAGNSNYMSSPVTSYDGAVGSGPNKQLLSVNANISAIDIPVSVIYKFDQHYYTSAGLSYLNVISEKRNNTYIQTSRINEDIINPATGQFYTKLVSSEVEEQGKETPLKGNSYLGFFNFSLGRRQRLFNKYHILIEPFIKVPIGKLSDEDLRLTNSGIKFQVSF